MATTRRTELDRLAANLRIESRRLFAPLIAVLRGTAAVQEVREVYWRAVELTLVRPTVGVRPNPRWFSRYIAQGLLGTTDRQLFRQTLMLRLENQVVDTDAVLTGVERFISELASICSNPGDLPLVRDRVSGLIDTLSPVVEGSLMQHTPQFTLMVEPLSEMSSSQKEASEEVRGLARPILEHVLKVLLHPRDYRSVNSWRREIAKWIVRLALIRLKPNNRPPAEAFLFRLLWADTYEDKECGVASLEAAIEHIRDEYPTARAVETNKVATACSAFYRELSRRCATRISPIEAREVAAELAASITSATG